MNNNIFEKAHEAMGGLIKAFMVEIVNDDDKNINTDESIKRNVCLGLLFGASNALCYTEDLFTGKIKIQKTRRNKKTKE